MGITWVWYGYGIVPLIDCQLLLISRGYSFAYSKHTSMNKRIFELLVFIDHVGTPTFGCLKPVPGFFVDLV